MGADTLRRLQRLRMRRTLDQKDDDFLAMILDDALESFLTLTNRTEDPGQRIDGLICRIAVVWANMEGVEGATKAEEGDVKREYLDIMPTDIQREIRRWKLVPGLHHAVDDN
ncbi:MAG: phage head-tail connector protein [Candidatus Methanomethylophilaceae archaeon]